MEISSKLLDALNIRGRIEVADASTPHLRSALGQFDVITCSDVVEHVPDVPRLLTNLAEMLSPTGVLYIAIPNRQSPQWIRRDPHFQSFGIVLLPREDAIEYHLKITGWDRYDVGDYHDWRFYKRLLRANGLVPTLCNQAPLDLAALLSQLEQEFCALEAEGRLLDTSRIGDELGAKVRGALNKVIEAYRAEAADAGRSAAAGAALVRDFHWSMWHVLATRHRLRRIGSLLWRWRPHGRPPAG